MGENSKQKRASKTVSKEKPAVVEKKRHLTKIREGIRRLPDKKPHLDFIAAILTIPLLALTLYLNLSNLKNKTTPTPTPALTPTPVIEKIFTTQGVTPKIITATPQPTPNNNTCIKDIGPIDISYPNETQTVSDNPLCIQIDYQSGNYCSVVWSYRINNSTWSDYSNNSVCLYNLSSGNNTFQLQVKSLVSPSTQTLTRHFSYIGATPTPTGVPVSQSPITTPTSTQ